MPKYTRDELQHKQERKLIMRTKRKLLAVFLLFIMVVGVFNISPTLPAEAKTVTKISKTSPSGSGFKLRLGNTKKLKMTLYTDGYGKPTKKVTLSADQEGIVSIGKVSYKKNTYYDWYGKKHISYNAAAEITPIMLGSTTITAKTKNGKKVEWKVNVRNAFTEQMAEGELGFIKWMLARGDLSEERIADLNTAKRILEMASAEKISAWLPDLKDSDGNSVKDGITLDCSRKTDAAHISRLHANYKAYKELISMQKKDAYRQIFMNDTYGDTASLPNYGEPYTNFTVVAGSMVDEDRFDVYKHHNPRWGEISSDYSSNDYYNYDDEYYDGEDDGSGYNNETEYYSFASSEVWASPSDAAASVDLWFSERDLVDNAVKALGYNKNSMTNSQLDEAVEKASKKGVVGHYTFCLYADHNDALGFASSSGGSLGHAMWRDGIVAKYTFKEMDDYVTEYLNEIGY